MAPTYFTDDTGQMSPVSHSAPGSLDHWLTERYCLYAMDWAQRLYRAEIHHVPWPLQPAEVEIEANSMALAAGIRCPAIPRLAYAERLDLPCGHRCAWTGCGGRRRAQASRSQTVAGDDDGADVLTALRAVPRF